MKYSSLKKIRLSFAIAFFIIVCVLFLDFRHLVPESFFEIFLWLQFVPSVIKHIGAGEAAALGFIAILILTFLSGRSYCSFLCPLGIMQDIISRAGGKIKKRFGRFGFKKPHTFLRYAILVLTVIITLTGGVYILGLLDPYGIFGRFMTYFVRPVVIIVNNFLASILGHFDIYTLVDTRKPSFKAAVYVIPAIFLLLTGIMSLMKGRLYCNTVCPVGTFLGLISKVSLFRIRIDNVKCSKCGRCAIACKSSCIDFLNMEIDNSRCVDCFNCIGTCPDNAISFGFSSPAKPREGVVQVDEKKRHFVIGSLLMFFGLSQRTLAQERNGPVPKKESTVKENKTSPVSPPGSTSIKNFTSKCTACSLCVSACPNNVLIPSFTEYGIAGIMQPHMDYHKGFCAYECTRCLEICPTGALLPLLPEAKKLTQIGRAVFIKENCIVQTERTACGACAESCPTKAVHMVPFTGNLTIPSTTDDICIGCGHCEFACPVTPYKAIFVNGNPVHAAAKKPENIKTELKHEDFPF
ncbi:MAG: 4Fe-4S binding protein [Bacteroidales bacterium]|nr:4Fe-4S binding protein [Bacteroidales bacterium]